MIRLCILGNSHVAALKTGADPVLARNPDLRLGFFAARSDKTRAMAVEGMTYRPQTRALADQFALTSGGLRDINPAEWDAYLIYGYGSRRRSGDFMHGLSRDFREALFTARLRDSLLAQHLDALRGLSDAPLFAALTPLELEGPRRARLLAHSAEVALAQAQLCDGFGAQLIAQPEASRLRDRFTHPEYGQAAPRLADAAGQRCPVHEAGDYRHMNAAYGALWLRAFLPVLRGSLSGGRVRQVR